MHPEKHFNIAAVSYLNTLPFVYGLTRSDELSDTTLKLMVPSDCATSLLKGDSQVALVPAGALEQLKPWHLIGDYCIGAEGAVKTVLLLSNVPIQEIGRIYLDTDSRTSIRLVKILAARHWKINPEWLPLPKNGISLNPTDAVVAIGDKTFGMKKEFVISTDLAYEWMLMTGLPFVFAAWISKLPLPGQFTERFNKALEYGITHISEAVDSADNLIINPNEALTYLTQDISYHLNDEKREAMQLFLKLAQSIDRD